TPTLFAAWTATWLAAVPALAQPPEKPNGGDEPERESLLDDISDEELLEAAGDPEVIEIIEAAPPGSAHAVTEQELERFEHDDIHKVLSAVPGVYIREEDGYGL